MVNRKKKDRFFNNKTSADVHIYYISTLLVNFAKNEFNVNLLKDLENLSSLLKTVKNRKGIKEYLNNDPRAKNPFLP